MIFFLLLSLSGGVAGALLMKAYGWQFGFADIPGQRSSHINAVPKGAGIGFIVVFLFASIYLKMPFYLYLPVSAVAFLSLLGDRITINPFIRLFFQFACALFFLIGYFGLPGSFFNFVFIVFFMVFISGSANFYNFMDGIDGIACITGIIAFFFLAFYAYTNGFSLNLVFLNLAAGFSFLGFLPFNFPKAKVFMGDAGSIFTGFLFACMVILLSEKLNDFIYLCGFLFFFYADELTTAVIRIKDQDSLFKPHRRHLYQIVVNELGVAHWKTSFVYGILQLITGVCILILKAYSLFFIIIFYAFIFALFIMASLFLRKKTVEKQCG